MSVIYGFKFKRIACTCICVTFAAVLQVSLNAEENDNQPILRKYFRKWQSRPYQHKSQGQRSEKTKQKNKTKKKKKKNNNKKKQTNKCKCFPSLVTTETS